MPENDNEQVTVNKKDLKCMLQLYEVVESADAIYKGCQAGRFREFVRNFFISPVVAKSYNALKEAVEK